MAWKHRNTETRYKGIADNSMTMLRRKVELVAKAQLGPTLGWNLNILTGRFESKGTEEGLSLLLFEVQLVHVRNLGQIFRVPSESQIVPILQP
jgi:hypothetical protein